MKKCGKKENYSGMRRLNGISNREECTRETGKRRNDAAGCGFRSRAMCTIQKLKAVLTPFSPKSGGIDSQDPCCFFEVLCGLKNLLDVPDLELLE